MSASAWILLIVLWQGVAPTVSAVQVKSEAQCLRMAKDFTEGEQGINENGAPTEAERFYVECKLVNVGEVNAL